MKQVGRLALTILTLVLITAWIVWFYAQFGG